MLHTERFNMFSLRRIIPADDAGISGARIITLIRATDDEDSPERDTETKYPTVGWRILAESFSHWYITSDITEIISVEIESFSADKGEDKTTVIFKTLNSTYEWTKH